MILVNAKVTMHEMRIQAFSRSFTDPGEQTERFKSRLLFSYHAPRQVFFAEVAALSAATSAKKTWRGAQRRAVRARVCVRRTTLAKPWRANTRDVRLLQIRGWL